MIQSRKQNRLYGIFGLCLLLLLCDRPNMTSGFVVSPHRRTPTTTTTTTTTNGGVTQSNKVTTTTKLQLEMSDVTNQVHHHLLADNPFSLLLSTTMMDGGTTTTTTTTATATSSLSVSGLVAKMMSTMLLLPTLPTSFSFSSLQITGESWLVALLAVAVIQGIIIGHQYATNPKGELIVPRGKTYGTVSPSTTTTTTSSTSMLTEYKETTTSDDDESKKTTSGILNLEIPPFPGDLEQDSNIGSGANESSSNFFDDVDITAKRGWWYVNRFLVFALPLVASRGTTAFLEYGHLFHAGALIGGAKFYDFFRKIPMFEDDEDEITPKFLDEEEQLCSIFNNEKPSVLVLGDSMSVGIGCVNEFDPEKNAGIARRIEQLDDEPEGEGPVFPRVLAQTVSDRLGKDVQWRSAGVDGGDTLDIMEHLLPIVKEEVENGTPPDVVVVLTGSNDMKQILNPKRGATVRGFRSNLLTLVHEIRKISPTTKVCLPALPTCKLDPDGIINVFPLSIFFNSLIGFWDMQKMEAARVSPDTVLYYGLSVDEVFSWYDHGESEKVDPSAVTGTLLSADGIHPNANSYAKWGCYVGNKLADTCQNTKTEKTEEEEVLEKSNVKELQEA